MCVYYYTCLCVCSFYKTKDSKKTKTKNTFNFQSLTFAGIIKKGIKSIPILVKTIRKTSTTTVTFFRRCGQQIGCTDFLCWKYHAVTTVEDLHSNKHTVHISTCLAGLFALVPTSKFPVQTTCIGHCSPALTTSRHKGEKQHKERGLHTYPCRCNNAQSNCRRG